MSATDVDVDLEVAIQTAERPHVACCVRDMFLCGRQFHPELVASESDDEGDCCVTCVDRCYEMLCPPMRPSHSHCGINPLQICPED